MFHICFHSSVPIVSAVVQLIPGAAAPAAVPANDGRAALPV